MNAPTGELAKLAELQGNLELYARTCLKIKSKSGKTMSLQFNRAQRYVHRRLEEQRAKTGGKVRALILKARQQGFSTYVAARFYHRTSLNPGMNTYILTHEQTATNNLFGMVERYHEHTPLRPSTGAANAKELAFDKLDGGYAVGTAGTKAVGRSKTVQLFHGSEVAFWPNASDHFAGVVQTIPDLAGTEIILESTANGVGGEFHERWQMAENDIGDFIAIFVPWFWSNEYRRPVPPDFELSHARGADGDMSEAEYMEAYNLTLSQMVWRRAKMAELKDPLLFKQEYPTTAAEAFQTTGHDSYIKASSVLRARKRECEAYGPLIMGADPSRFGNDKFSVIGRQGRKLVFRDGKSKIDTVGGANWLKGIIDKHNPARMFVDVGGQGAGVYDILVSYGPPYTEIVVGVNFGSDPIDQFIVLPDGSTRPGPKNRRAEMWMHSKDWLEEEGGADIFDDDSLQSDATGPGYKYDIKQRLVLESKQEMRARGVRSPDDWDAVALTFAEPVFSEFEAHRESTEAYRRRSDIVRTNRQGWML